VPGRGKTLAEQTRFALGEIRRAVEAAGGSMDDVVELMSFHIDLSAETFGEIAAVRREFFPKGFTSWTAVGTSGLLADGALMEIRAVAVVGSGRSKTGVPPQP
jgi:enamine deaminase RidA (YjgF/YER057c/UK114 family)